MSTKYLDRFLRTGKLEPHACYYFDPPLEDYEMFQLKSILRNVQGNQVITYPLIHLSSEDIQKLLWFDTDGKGEINGWQNPEPYRQYEDGSENDVLMNLKDIKNWYREEGILTTFINGRDFLGDTNFDTNQAFENLFDQLTESRLNEIGGKRAKDTHVIYRDNNMVIVVPLSFESAKSFSRKTQYCTGGDCSRGSERTSKSMFKQHTSRGDILYRIFFKDGTKVRLTWNGDINAKDFHWGLGKKDSYPTFTDRNMSNPFDLEQIREIRLEQLELEFESEPRIKELDEWEKKFARQWGWGVHDISGILEKIREKWGMPKFGDSPSKPMSPENWDKMHEEETKVYDIYLKKKKEILGKYYGKTAWWNEGHEMLYKAIIRIPENAISKMVEYSMSGDYKPITESEGDDFDWVKDLGIPKIEDSQLRQMGSYNLKPLRLEDLRPGLFIKRKNGKFLYELGEELPLNFKDTHTGEQLNGELGYMIINVSNGKRYMGRKHQIVRDFYLIQSNK